MTTIKPKVDENRKPKTVEELLPIETLKDLYGDADSFWMHRISVPGLHKLFAGEVEKVTIVAADDHTGAPDYDEAGIFSWDRFRAGIVQRAVERWLEEMQDAADNDAAIQYAVFGDIIFG